MMKNVLHSAIILIATLAGATGCDSNSMSASSGASVGSEPISAKKFAAILDVKTRVITNRSTDECDKTKVDGLCYQAELVLTSPESFIERNWQIKFSNMSPVQQDSSELFDIVHINGDLHKLVPTEKFSGFKAGEVYVIPFQAGFWALSQTDRMPNYYLVDSTDNAFLIESTVPKVDVETGLEILPHVVPLSLDDKHFKRTPADNTSPATAEWLFQENNQFYENVDVTYSILPTPKSIKAPRMAGNLDLTRGIAIEVNGIELSGIEAAIERLAYLGVEQAEDGLKVVLTKAAGLSLEGYQLATTRSGIEIVASTEVGAFYGLQSIASLLDPNSLTVPFIVIEDEPRFEFRGMHIDVSRNFKSKEFILSVLDQMAAYKLNKFHFHLADDEGWRVAIPGLPELTDVGAFRCHEATEKNCLLPQLGVGPNRDSKMNGYYSFEDYKEILAYAAKRHIQVIPSMDMPGHSRAAIKSMAVRYSNLAKQGKLEQAKQYLLHDIEDTTQYESIQFYNDNTLNACMDSSYDFIGKVVDELQIMHAEAGNPLTKYHIGADETAGAWVESSACEALLKNNVMGISEAEDIAAYFVERVSQLLAKRNIEAAGWNDGMGHTNARRMPEVVQSNAWTPLFWGGHSAAHEQANRGWQLVVSSPDALYFDFPYEADANERGYYWAARRLNSRKVFSMMPENLPAHAEYWLDREENPYVADDTKKLNDDGTIKQQPMGKEFKFYGMQGQLWSETVRTDNQASYMIFPRLYALAERAWHKANWELDYNYQGAVYGPDTNHFTKDKRLSQGKDWIRFSNHIGKKTLSKADSVGLFYRLPTPGAVIQDGQLLVNTMYFGLPVEYRTEQSDWQLYSGPTVVSGLVEVRTTTLDGSRKGRSIAVR
ncbi:family 20 glycosylhydrolase [Psychrosphaera sp. 1_MG-2023]|uniref:family 20 glycosylhydrolase n=1 Tax=Psychrosphaera sp. 1_MG-2023 TaxID=3062643 RepID=UPI0026E43BEF|nr:family 20 glycosylhydrolase [Psychrosphaera sp. 1_MG-2023]MDO6718155.1 family 20 glycosylhydrolase [Psychrosphaera sp. 1_MG-2023]